MDEYEQQKNRKKTVYGIYLILANLPEEGLQNKNSNRLIAIIPDTIKINYLMDIVITQSLKPLESGVEVQLQDGTTTLVICLGFLVIIQAFHKCCNYEVFMHCLHQDLHTA